MKQAAQTTRIVPETDDPFADDDEEMWTASKAGVTVTTREPRLRELPEYMDIGCIVFPDDTFYVFWGYVIIALMMYTAIVTPFVIALVDMDQIEWLVVDTVVDGLFFTDVVINCFLAYYTDDNMLETRKRKILVHYMRTWMFVDLLACIPFQFILSTNKSYEGLVRVARLPRLYRLIKMAKLARMLKIIKHRRKIIRNMNNMMKVSYAVERLLWFTITFIVSIHLISCIWILVALFYETEHDNWILQYGFVDLDIWELYLTAFYWTVTTITTVGYGDISANNNQERLYCSLIMILGVFLYSYTIGSLSSLLTNLDSNKEKLNRKLEVLHDLSKEYHISKTFYNRLATALEYDHKQSRTEVNELLESLPTSLRNQLLVIIFERKISHNAFFTNKPSHFVAYVAPLLKQMRFEENDYVYKEGEHAAEMYFIVRGEVAQGFLKADEFVPYMTIEEGYYFGELDLMFSDQQQHHDTIQATRKSDVLTLSRNNFKAMLDNFPEQSLEIAALSKERHDRNAQLRRSALEEYAQQHKVKRHRSIPVNPKTRQKNQLWILNQLKTTGEAGVSTLVKEGEANDSIRTSSSNSDNSRISEAASSEESDNETTPSTNFERQQTLFESIQKPYNQYAYSSGAGTATSGFNQIINSRRGSLQAMPTFQSSSDLSVQNRMNKRIAKVEKNTGEMYHLIQQICNKLDISTKIPDDLPFMEPPTPAMVFPEQKPLHKASSMEEVGIKYSISETGLPNIAEEPMGPLPSRSGRQGDESDRPLMG